MAEAALPPSAVKGLGFDATCSLVVLDAAGDPLTVSASGDQRRNVIVWMDHRAMAEARQVNDTRDDVLRYVGGSISPEMEIPKLLWLKRHLPSTYNSGRSFLRSCRLSFVSRHRIDGAFDLHAGLQMELSRPRTALERQLFRARRPWRSRFATAMRRSADEIVAPGTPLGAGLTGPPRAISACSKGTPVGASLIDAHAGGVGTIGGRAKIGRAGRCVPPARLHHGNLGLHHGDDVGAPLRPGRLGSLLFGDGSRLLAQRRRPVRGGRGHRSSHQVPSGL